MRDDIRTVSQHVERPVLATSACLCCARLCCTFLLHGVGVLAVACSRAGGELSSRQTGCSSGSSGYRRTLSKIADCSIASSSSRGRLTIMHCLIAAPPHPHCNCLSDSSVQCVREEMPPPYPTPPPTAAVLTQLCLPNTLARSCCRWLPAWKTLDHRTAPQRLVSFQPSQRRCGE